MVAGEEERRVPGGNGIFCEGDKLDSAKPPRRARISAKNTPLENQGEDGENVRYERSHRPRVRSYLRKGDGDNHKRTKDCDYSSTNGGCQLALDGDD